MRVAILLSHFPPRWLGGTEVATRHLARELARRGHQIHVVTLWDEGLPEEEELDGFHLHRIQLLPGPFLPQLPFYFLRVLIKVRRIDPDLLHAQAVSLSAFMAGLIKKLLRKPYVVYARGSDIYLSPPWFKKTFSAFILRNADGIMALAADLSRLIGQEFQKKAVPIPNGIDTGGFQGLDKEQLRGKLTVRPEEKVLVFLGNLRAVKGVEYLLRALPLILREEPQARLLILGDGVERGRLEQMVAEMGLGPRVTFAGRVANEEVPGYLAACDLFVLPSLSESFGIVNLEAMAAGLPIVATKVGGIPEVVQDGENGFLVPPRNPEALAEKALAFLQDERLRGAVAERNRLKAAAFGWPEVARRVEGIYRIALADGGDH